MPDLIAEDVALGADRVPRRVMATHLEHRA
jgi:hypothetical protein